MNRDAALRSLVALGVITSTLACGSGSEADDDASTGGPANVVPIGPFDADVFIADLHWEVGGLPSIGDPTNVTRRPGYDNQPHFLPDGSGFWYTTIDEMDGQADIWRYDLAGGMVTRVTMSNPESEYSATPLPDGSGISTIRVEADSTQRLWRFDTDGSNAAVILEDVAPVGYHVWVDETTVVMFVLGSPATLQRGDTRTGNARVLAEDIGRSIQRIPNSYDVSYVQRHEDGSTTIMRLSGSGGPAVPIIEGIGGGDFHAWASDGVLLMARESIVYASSPGTGGGWDPVADFSSLHISISRLAVSPDRSQIAMVAEPAPIDLDGS